MTLKTTILCRSTPPNSKLTTRCFAQEGNFSLHRKVIDSVLRCFFSKRLQKDAGGRRGEEKKRGRRKEAKILRSGHLKVNRKSLTLLLPPSAPALLKRFSQSLGPHRPVFRPVQVLNVKAANLLELRTSCLASLSR